MDSFSSSQMREQRTLDHRMDKDATRKITWKRRSTAVLIDAQPAWHGTCKHIVVLDRREAHSSVQLLTFSALPAWVHAGRSLHQPLGLRESER